MSVEICCYIVNDNHCEAPATIHVRLPIPGYTDLCTELWLCAEHYDWLYADASPGSNPLERFA